MHIKQYDQQQRFHMFCIIFLYCDVIEKCLLEYQG